MILGASTVTTENKLSKIQIVETRVYKYLVSVFDQAINQGFH